MNFGIQKDGKHSFYSSAYAMRVVQLVAKDFHAFRTAIELFAFTIMLKHCCRVGNEKSYENFLIDFLFVFENQEVKLFRTVKVEV